jgi:alpha-glucosidase
MPFLSTLLFALTPFTFFAAAPMHAADVPVLRSPDGRIEMSFAVQPGKNASRASGQLTYAVRFRGKPVLDASKLGLDLEGAEVLGSEITIAKARSSSGTDDYTLTNTKVSKVHEDYNALTLHVIETGRAARAMDVEARAYNSGIAFRYLLPAQQAISSLRQRGEATEFQFSEDDTAWVLALPNYRSSYESEYVRYALSALANQGGVASHFLIGMPVLLHQPGTAWLSLMEADLEGNSSAYVTNPSGSWQGHYFAVKLSPRWDDPSLVVTGTLPHHSAWRVIGIADTPGALLEANLQVDLSPTNRLTDTSWIHSGKASWNWWSDNVSRTGKSGDDAFTTDLMKEYVDFAAANGLRYFMLDAGWSKGPDITALNGKVAIPELVRYAAAKNVKVWIWLYGEAVMQYMREAFPLYEKWGVAGLKIDFINRDDQDGIQFYYNVAKFGAEHHLMIDFHGSHTPWGLMRTYPNVMSYEGVLGMEQNKVGRRDSPINRLNLAFTRLLAGPMDYTAGSFDNSTEASFVARNTAPMTMGTRAQQLALYVVYENPIPMLSDSPKNYEGQPGLQFLKDVPVAWDESHVLNGEPDQFITIARRHETEWDLGSITNWTACDLQVPLTFLGEGRYTAELYEDARDSDKSPSHLNISRRSVRRGDILSLHLQSGGGAAVRLTPESSR